MNEQAIKGLEEYRQKLANGEIVITRMSLEEKHEENPTRKTAIDLFCKTCVGGDAADNHIKDIRQCSAKKCPLYQFRPYK